MREFSAAVWYRPGEIAALLGTSVRTLRRWGLVRPRQRYYLGRDIMAFLDQAKPRLRRAG